VLITVIALNIANVLEIGVCGNRTSRKVGSLSLDLEVKDNRSILELLMYKKFRLLYIFNLKVFQKPQKFGNFLL